MCVQENLSNKKVAMRLCTSPTLLGSTVVPSKMCAMVNYAEVDYSDALTQTSPVAYLLISSLSTPSQER